MFELSMNFNINLGVTIRGHVDLSAILRLRNSWSSGKMSGSCYISGCLSR